ncbi:MAG: UDP-N-acetylglucosamine diphosphorylase [Limisphaerales bacterium]
MFAPADLFDLTQSEHAPIFDGCAHAWEALPKIGDYLRATLRPALHNRCEGIAFIGPDVFIGEGTVVEDGAMIKGPAIIGRDCKIRHNAYLRENVLVGDGCVVGNSSELKNALLFNRAEVPHFNYVGDSILGFRAHLGAGVKISNLKITPGHVSLEVAGRLIDTGLRKFGALLGDASNVGCNAVLNPGSILGRRALIYPNVSWRGYLPPDSIAKNRSTTEVVTLGARAPRT